MRIRTIKPEFFKHEGIAALSFPARMLFVGMWGMADRDGRMEDRPRRIKIEVLPYDDVEIEPLLSELTEGGFIHRYSCRETKVIQIHNFHKHQRITGKEAEAQSELPEYDPASCTDSAGNQRGNNGETTETTGREGKGKEGKEAGSAEPPGSTAKKGKPPEPDDDEWLLQLQADPTYAVLSIRTEWGKMHAWCSQNRKVPSRKRFINWINRCERPTIGPHAPPTPRPPNPEPPGWREFVNREYPNFGYKDSPWDRIPHPQQLMVSDAMRKSNGPSEPRGSGVTQQDGA